MQVVIVASTFDQIDTLGWSRNRSNGFRRRFL